MLTQIKPQQYKTLRESSNPPMLIDVREQWELEICQIRPNIHIPLGKLLAADPILDVINENLDTPLVMLCHHGYRSAQGGAFLISKGFTNISNLQGGIAAWAEQIDQSMPMY